MLGMSIADYFTVGAAVLARFIELAGRAEEGAPGISPRKAFGQVTMAKGTWEAFFALNAGGTSDALRDELIDETSRYGESTYSSLTFERFPLVADRAWPLPAAVDRQPAPAASRRYAITSSARPPSPMDAIALLQLGLRGRLPGVGRANLRRGAEMEDSGATIIADVPYGPRSEAGRRSSDVILEYERNPVFVEVVSGRLTGSSTQGDLKCLGLSTSTVSSSKRPANSTGASATSSTNDLELPSRRSGDRRSRCGPCS